MKSKTQFVVLGAGYAGMTVAVHLDNKLSKKNFQVDIAKVIKEFKKEAHLESVTSGEATFAANIYKNDPISNLLSSIFLAGFSISKTFKDKIPSLHIDNKC
jgi:NADH dehydrogenase FAD-containing subunit